ncbi:MAG: ABC transporter permease [Thermomicrobiales bacterium]
MRGLRMLTLSEFKLFIREPAAAFFTLAFPLILLFVFGSIFGNDRDPDFGNWGAADVMVQGYIGLIIGTVAFMGIPVTIGSYRQYGILKWLRATPVTSPTVIVAHIIVNGIVTGMGTMLLLIVGRLVYGLRTPEAPFALVGAWLLSYLSFSVVGFTLAGIFSTARTAQAVGSAIYFPQMFLSGASFPRELFPDGLERATRFLPMTQINILVSDLWRGDGLNWIAVMSLSLIGMAAAVIAFRYFRCE